MDVPECVAMPCVCVTRQIREGACSTVADRQGAKSRVADQARTIGQELETRAADWAGKGYWSGTWERCSSNL